MYSRFQRLQSLRHRFWFGVSERLRWSRGVFRETPARVLPALPAVQSERIVALQQRYRVCFEQTLSAASSINNYEYLDILDRTWSACALSPRASGTVVDIGCASFWYAATLQAFFEPETLFGVDVEGHRLFRNGHTRIDYARGYLADLPHAQFIVQDYLVNEQPADVVTAWFPFLTPAALLAWRLPLNLLKPGPFFSRIYHNLRPSGLLVMINHGIDEAGCAEQLCFAAGLRRVGLCVAPGVLSDHRLKPAIASCWERAGPRKIRTIP